MSASTTALLTKPIRIATRTKSLPNPTFIIVFFLSGVAALLYQVAWQRLLTVYYGVTALSVTIIVTVYLFGLGLGAFLGGTLAEQLRRTILVYAFIEAIVGIFGIFSPTLLDALGRTSAGSPYALAVVYIFMFLSLPTLLMGSTLPLLTKIWDAYCGNIAKTVSVLYFANTLGAAVGASIGSYVLISFLGLATTVRIAASINLILPLFILIAGRTNTSLMPRTAPEGLEGDYLSPRLIYSLVFCTGFLAIGYEVMWFRILSILVKDSPYAFSSILGEYLLGIAIGSFALPKILEAYPKVRRRDLFLVLQSLIAVYVLVSVLVYYYATRYTDFSIWSRASFSAEIHPGLGRLLPLFPVIDIFVWPLFFVLIPTMLMGASFPLISSLSVRAADREGETVGKIYFFMVLGNVFGGIVTGFLLLPFLKTERTLLLFVSIGLLIGAVLRRTLWRTASGLLLAGGLLVFPHAGKLYETMHFPPGPGYQFYLEEGREGVVGTYSKERSLITYINGSAHGGRPGFPFYARALEALGHVSRAKNVLVIGYGTGSFVETCLKVDELTRLTLVEVNNTVVRNSLKIDILKEMFFDPRVRLIVDDGRRFLLNSHDAFDLIMLDPLRSKTSGSNNLYSYEFFILLKKHLAPGGTVLLWTDEFQVIPLTLTSAFREVRFYSNNLLLASNEPFITNPKLRADVLMKFDTLDRQRILAVDQQFLGDQRYIRQWSTRKDINHDWTPVTEYFVGLYVKNVLGGSAPSPRVASR